MKFTERLIIELAPHGKVEEYAKVAGTDAGIKLIVQTLGKQRAGELRVRRKRFTASSTSTAFWTCPPTLPAAFHSAMRF
jgi:hypothetical protein